MGSPYLKSGEAIVLTTNRISVDHVLYEVMLTTERIFFIDEQNARFEPRIILLSAIQSVHGGGTPAGDPVITLVFRAGSGAAEQLPVNLVFSHDKNENRKPERDDWVRTLIRLSVTQHEVEIQTKIPVEPETTGEHGLRPAVRRGIAPEKVRPLSSMSTRQPVPPPLEVILDEVDIGGEIPVPAVIAATPESQEKPAADIITDEPSADFTPVRGQPPAAPVRIIIPKIIEELLPEKRPAVPQIIEELLQEKKPAAAQDRQGPAADFDHEALFRTIPTAARSMTITEEQTPQSPGLPEPVPRVAGIPVAGTAPVGEAGVAASAAEKPKEVPAIIKALQAGPPEPAEEEPAGKEPAVEKPAPEPVLEIPKTVISGVPESHVTLAIPDNVVQDIIHHSATEEIFQREPEAAEAPPVRHPIPPAHEVRPHRPVYIYAAVLIIIALVAGGAMLLLLQEPSGTDTPVIPVTTTVQETTVPPVTTTATAALPVTIPAVTPSLPARAASSIPQSGVYVRVNSASSYFGRLGNPGLLKQVSDTGDHVYPILRSDRPVQVSVQKNNNSGAILAVEVYRDGTLIATRSVTSPMGTVDLLIDPRTALPPGLNGNETVDGNAVTPVGHLENF